jgi:inner membrane protein
MDPLTHTLFGANLAATRLGQKSRFASSALVVGANFPDLDVLAELVSDDASVGFRRGWTHGLPAHVVLPFVLTGILMLIDRWRPDAGRRFDRRWILILSTIGIWTHPFLDWLNTYGMRWLMPFSGKWSYGDAVFIMDPWLWLVLGLAWLLGRRATWRLGIAFGAIVGLIANVVAGRSTEYIPVVVGVAAVLGVALLLPPVRGKHRLSAGALALSCAYIAMRLVISEASEATVERELGRSGVGAVQTVMVSPDPIDPLKWGFVARSGDVYRFGRWHWMGRRFVLSPERVPVAKDSPAWKAARAHPSIRGFMTWVRFPSYEIEYTPTETRVYITDARRFSRGRGGFGSTVVVLPGRVE